MSSKVQAFNLLNAIRESKEKIGLYLLDPEYFVQQYCFPIQNEIDMQAEQATLYEIRIYEGREVPKLLPEARVSLLGELEKFKERCLKPFTEEEQCALDRLKESVDSLKLDDIREAEPEQNETYWELAIKQLDDTYTKLNCCIDAIKHILLGFCSCTYLKTTNLHCKFHLR